MARTSSLAAEAAPRCTARGSERIVKNGKNACGRQQFRCRACGASRALHPKSRETLPERKTEVLRAVAAERLSLRAAQRVFGVARNTIALWLQKKPKLCRP
jgi:transposase-like protein